MRRGGRRDNIWPHMTGVIFLVEVDGLSIICPSSDTGACFIIASYSRPYGVTHPTERCAVGICTGMCYGSTWSLSAWFAGKHNMVPMLLRYTLVFLRSCLRIFRENVSLRSVLIILLVLYSPLLLSHWRSLTLSITFGGLFLRQPLLFEGVCAKSANVLNWG